MKRGLGFVGPRIQYLGLGLSVGLKLSDLSAGLCEEVPFAGVGASGCLGFTGLECQLEGLDAYCMGVGFGFRV